MKISTVLVTQKCIDEGIKKSASSCPIANSLLRRFKYATWVQVYNAFDILIDDNEISVFPPDKNLLQDFINNFDTGKQTNPFSFRVLNKYPK